KLQRLVRMVGGDEGFYVLALHSFVEWYLRKEKGYGDDLPFGDLTWQLRNELLAERPDEFIDGLSCLARLGKQHFFTNEVRHAFETLDSQEAASATHLFVTFCTLIGLGDYAEVRKLAESLSGWRLRTSVIEQAGVLKSMQQELKGLQAQNRELLEQREAYEMAQGELRELQLQLSHSENAFETARRQEGHRDERIDELRHERQGLRLELKRLSERLTKFGDLERYLHYLGRFTIYTRTRMEFEQSISELTPEQEQAISAASMKKDFLIKGGAGTGKSLVLIEALRRSLEQKELDFDSGYVAFVTFTRTLARYNEYISAIKRMNLPVKMIRTVDSLFLRMLKAVDESYAFDFEAVERFCSARGSVPFLTAEELASELENFLFANAVTKEEYLEERIARRGMRKRLGSEQRAQVWEKREELVRLMESEKRFSKNYSRIKLLEHLRAHPDDQALRTISHVFLDEVQDLVPVDLMVMRQIARRSIIMAGDTDQSLYTGQSPFARAGINITGTTRVLRTNFRNTCQIHEAAEAFRGLSPEGTWDTTNEPFAFREGPPPELYLADTEEELLELMMRKVTLFVDDIGYEPENVAILVPRNVEIENAGNALTARGRNWTNVAGKDFGFSEQGSIRLCTLHSSKGLDFPVVLLYLPYLHRRELFDEERTEKLMRNLVYVGMTRAMDCLNVFIRPQEDAILNEVSAALGPT
ncbi:MAG TPA: UvrD-helicase domain-containing protein, partial [Spirochaetia bacterium]|nr:UvrD-helicase domain-containing protein [Spirochaetia bacterium]